MKKLCRSIRIRNIRKVSKIVRLGFWILKVGLGPRGILVCFWALFIRGILCRWDLPLIWIRVILDSIWALLWIRLLFLILCWILILAFFWKEKKLWIGRRLLKIILDCGFGLICLVVFLILGLLQQLLIWAYRHSIQMSPVIISLVRYLMILPLILLV